MTLTAEGLGSFGLLGKAIGLLDENGNPNASWFGDPVGGPASANQRGLRNVVADDGQRAALLDFVDEVLGPPDRVVQDEQTWVPLFHEDTPRLTIYAVVQPVAGAVHLGIGLEHVAGTAAPAVTTRVHVPIFRMPRSGAPALTADGPLPPWLLLGRAGGKISIGVDGTLTDATPTAGHASLGGAALTLGVPTSSEDPMSVALQLRDLQLPGASSPRTFDLDATSLNELGSDVFELITGLVRAQADALDLTQPALRPFAAITGLLGLRTVTGLPPMPLADLPTQGVAAIVGWVEQVLRDQAAIDAWLGQLVALIGVGSVDAARAAIDIAVGPVLASLGLRVQPGTGGHPTLVPWAEVSLGTRAGVRARVAADLIRIDTATGGCTALPDFRIEAVFGADASVPAGPALLPGADPHIGSLHTGVALDPTHRPAFVLTLSNVTIGGQQHDTLDLSTPQAAVDSAASVIEGALVTALGNLGPAGDLLLVILGLTPPAGVTGPDAAGLLAHPLAAMQAYWRALIATPAAAADVFGRVRTLITGVPATPVPGDGTPAAPWRIEIVDNVSLDAYAVGDRLAVDLVATLTTPVLADYEAGASLGLGLVRADLAVGHVSFAAGATAALTLGRADHAAARLDLTAISLELDRIALRAGWAPATGLRASLAADGLAVLVPANPFDVAAGEVRVALSLPTFDADGNFVLPAPDWADVERALAVLLAELAVPVVDACLDLVGWRGSGAHLALAGLLGDDPAGVVEAWIADLVLDCDRVRLALSPVAALLSGFQRGASIGTGTARSPFRCPIADEPRAPGLAVWLDPGCRAVQDELQSPLSALLLPEPPDMDTVVSVMRMCATSVPDLADLLVGRDSLATGLAQLVTRWSGTDGLVGRPGNLPDNVTGVELAGLTYDELTALGAVGNLAGEALEVAPAAVVHVGCEPSWTTGRPAGTSFDRSAPNPADTGTVPATGSGTWFVRLPATSVAATARPDRGAVGEQAARLTAVLAGRTAPIAVIAYGAAGAAAIRAAADLAAVSEVVTVGTPWAAPPAVDSLRGGLSGDALRLLYILERPHHGTWPEQLLAQQATAQQQVYTLLDRAMALLASTDEIPSALSETRRDDLKVTALFGSLDDDTLAAGIGAFVADAVQARFDLLSSGPDPVITALHAGIDLPVIDLDLGGLLIGAGATIELARVARAAPGPGLDFSAARGVFVDVHLGVHDGWLVGGPGSTSAVGDLRWMSVRMDVPLDSQPGTAELVLHEVNGFGVQRERWVVRADGASGAAEGGEAVTTALPEIRALLADLISRLRAAAPDVAAILELLGLIRSGGLDPDGLDRLLHDTKGTVLAAVAAAPADLAARLRALIPGASGSASGVGWPLGPATIRIDLATGVLTAGLQVDGAPHVEVDVTAGRTGVSATVAVGALDEHAGGLRLVGATGPSPSVALEWAAPGATAPRRLALLPTPDPGALRDLATVVLPAAIGHGLLSALRQQVSAAARPALDAALDAVGLLAPADALGGRGVVFPVGLLHDPGGWLRHAVEAWRTHAAASAVGLLDALAPLVVPARGAATGWPIAAGVTLGYSADSDRLRLLLDIALTEDLAGTTVTTHLAGGLLIGTDATVQPTVSASVDIDGRGLLLAVAPAATPPVRLSLVRAAPAPPLPIYPDGPGLGDALEAIGETVMPIVLNEVIGHRNDAASVLRDVGRAVFALCDALGLLDGTQVTAALVGTFAADPAGRLAARLPNLVSGAAAAIATALDPGGTIVGVTGPAGGVVTLGFGAGRSIKLVLDASGATPTIGVEADLTIDGVGRLVVERLRVSADGLDLTVRLGPVELDIGSFELRPMLAVRAGSVAGSARSIGLGLALDSAAGRSVEFRWALDATPPALVAVSRTSAGEMLGDAEQAGLWLLAVALSMAGGVLVDGLAPMMTAPVKAALRGVVFTDVAASTEIDPGLALDLLAPEQLLHRLERLVWNVATGVTPLSITIDGLVTIGFANAPGTAGSTQLGVSVSLAAGRRFVIADSDTKVELEVDATWVEPAVQAGLSIFVVEGTKAGDVYTFAFAPGVTVAGLGLRFSKASGPVLELGAIALDSIAVHVYGEATALGTGGGVNLELGGLAFAPGGGGGGNAVANSIMNDAGQASPASRPAFSPSVSIQRHPGPDGAAVSLRAGPPPGPWWMVIQRQLGPLYLERVGFDTAEAAGRVTRVTLLFDGRVSIFGLTAAVDQLSLSWLGGDLLRIEEWAVDLQGLAVSADMSGVSLAGGMLKTTADTGISYVGMLMGKFGVYGLSVFGGYTDDHGNPSFFVFGAINGPIGGPPAFFLTGLGGGLGINRGLHIPDDVSRFNEFPFIQALDPAAQPPADPMQELRDLNVYFPPQRGNFWFAAGISFTCFSLVDGVAVVAVSFGDGLEIDLLGLARLALPRPQAALVSIELGLLARFSTREGVFMIRAGLTANSWLLYPEVRLTGGFAFAIWWKGPLAGQFVMTLGGYHPDFHRDGYPDVPRLGLTWQVSDAIVIKGGSYFALTSEALMAGTDVVVTADFGWAWARIAFGANGIVYFDPFWFEVDAFARISAGVKIDTWLGTISFSISVGATVKVWGPEFSGEATLEVGPCDFSVSFGSEQRVEPRTLEWPEFVAKYLEDAGGGHARALSAITGAGSLPAATGGQLSAPTPDGTVQRPFEVYAEFEFTVVTTVPAAALDLGLAGGPVPITVRRSDGAVTPLGLKPMKASTLNSTLQVVLEMYDEAARAYLSIPAQLQLLATNLAAAAPRPEGSTYGTDAFPIGVWGQPDLPGLPAAPIPKGEVLVAGNLLRLVAEAQALNRGPEIDYYRVVSAHRPLPLQASGPDRGALLQRADSVVLPQATTAAAALDAARARLFAAPIAGAPPAGVLRAGQRSALARAAYAGDVSAPPLFGTLAEGMAPENAADGTASRTDPPTPPEPPTARPPMVAAYLSSGNGVARRAQGTTVADARMKRRPAPTLDSVQARIGAHLPIQLHRTTLPSAVRDATLVAPDTPRTTVPGADRSYAYGSDAVAGFVGGLGGASKRGRRTRTSPSPKAAAGIRPMAAKDVVVLTLPDAAVDSDGRRPSLEVSGSARVSVLAGGGAVLADDVVTGQVDIPPGAALIAVQADGTLPGTGAEAGPDTVLDGLAGWQAGTRICALGSGAALGPGCVVTVQASPAAPGVAWTTAGALFGNAATVFTRFSRAVTTIAVVVSGAEAGRLDAMDLELIGATLARAADGSQRAPVVVLSGNQAVAVYAVEPDATAGRIAAVSVRVRAGGDWHVDGVLGGDVSVGDLTSAIVRRGVAGAAGRLLAGTGAGCTVSWQERPPPGTPKPVRRTSRRATAKAATNATRAAGSTAPARKGGLPHGRQ